jgi:hypothetical protein
MATNPAAMLLAATPATLQECPGQLLNGSWDHFYNASTNVMFVLLGDKASSDTSSKGWADSRDTCRSLGLSWDLAYYDSFDQQMAVERSTMWTRNMNLTSRRDSCYWLGYYEQEPLVQCPAGSAYPSRTTCFYTNWSSLATAWVRADGASPTAPYPIKEATAEYVYTWWGTYPQETLGYQGGEPTSGSQCILAESYRAFSAYANASLANGVYSETSYVDRFDDNAPGAVWGWADAFNVNCLGKCRVICRGSCVITGECAACGPRHSRLGSARAALTCGAVVTSPRCRAMPARHGYLGRRAVHWLR